MRKRVILFFFVGALIVAPVLSGCQGTSSGEARELKESGIAQMEGGDYDGALENFREALDELAHRMGPEQLDIYYYEALAQYRSGDAAGAIDTYTMLTNYDEKNWEIYYLRGNIYLREGEEDEALADYEKAASLNPDDTEMYVNIYENLADAGLGSDGQTYADEVLQMRPRKAEEYYFLGDIYFLTGDYENARKNLLTASEKGYDRALLLLGSVYEQEGDSGQAKEAFSSYMEKHPDDPEALNGLGEVALAAGEYEEAIDYLDSALDASSGGDEGAAILKNLIIAYEYTEDFDSAYEAAGQYLDIRSSEDVEREYEFLETRVGNK